MRLAIFGLAAAFAAAAAVAGPALAWAQGGSSLAPSLKEGEAIARCPESTPAHRDGLAALDALERRIQGLSDGDSPADAIAALQALLRTECFRLATAENPRVIAPDSSRSLREWWGRLRTGGRDWMRSYLSVPGWGPVDGRLPFVVVPPDVRRTLDPATHPDHPLRSLLCPRGDDPSCGAATRGWKRRADEYFDIHPVLEEGWMRRRSDDAASVPADAESISQTCKARVSSAPEARRYQDWRACVEEHRPRRVALPLGEFRAPQAGWIVISGRRGHYDFCDTTSAFDLATGAAFIHDRCASLVLERDGQVDADATRYKTTHKVRRGTVMVESLREAVWMMLFRGEAERVQVTGLIVPLPDGLVPQVTANQERSKDDQIQWQSTAQTTLTWRWVRRADSSLEGELTWPFSADAAEAHAASLLAIAEESFAEECPASRPVAPGVLTGSAALKALKTSETSRVNDVSDENLAALDRDYRESFEKWQAMPACRRAAR